MEIKIKNCNNIIDGKIALLENSLNIKYAINGTGKSTIANAIKYSIKDQNEQTNLLHDLKPYKFLNDSEVNPEIHGIDSISSLKTFDEKYINEYTFQEDELLKGSFDVFIKDQNYRSGLDEINKLTQEINNIFNNNKDLEEIINNFEELSNSFGKSSKTGLHGSSILAKAFKDGNKIENVPEELKDYKDFIQHSENYKWIKWQLEGKNYLNINDSCPYCVTNIEKKKEKINKVSDTYNSKSVQNLNAIIDVFSKLNLYFSDSTKDKINEFVKNINGYDDDQVAFLKEIKDQIDRLQNKIITAKNISFISLKDVDKVVEELSKYRLDIKLYNHLSSSLTIEKTSIINATLDEIIKKAGILQGKVNKQKKYIESLVKKNKKGIDEFLKNAGYDYTVDLIEDINKNYQLKLLHKDCDGEILKVKSRLSFGERNAFALVLFMYDVLKTNPNLVILDDPISSFDKNKKYAIIEMLFRKKESLKDKTVLMLTHDFEPIIDMVFHHRDRFSIPNSSFLYNDNHKLVEIDIERSDINTFIQIIGINLKESKDIINKLVYLRRYYEINNNKDNEYHILSSLFHKKEFVEIKENGIFRKMNVTDFKSGIEDIKKYVPDFNYSTIVNVMKNKEIMKIKYFETKNNYEKLHMYRIIFDDLEEGIKSDIIAKFINESFHIENDYIYQLNPVKYPTVPSYVIEECDKLIQTI